MNNEQQPKDNQKSDSDKWYAGTPKLRVDKKHGGVNVEEIASPQLMNDPDCKHEQWELDPTETEFIAYRCKNPLCDTIRLFDKGE